MRHALLNNDGLVVNVVEAGEEWEPPAGLSKGQPGGEIGDTWNGITYERPQATEAHLTQSDYAAAIQQHVDATAQARGYHDGFALAGYVMSTVPAWVAEASAFIAWRDSVWIYAYAELAKVLAAGREQQTITELIAELPAMEWPV